jgi:hypothetical protein
LFPGPTMSGYSWRSQVPRAPVHEPGVTSLVVVSRSTSAEITLPASLLRAHAPVLPPPVTFGVPSDAGSVQVAVRPCGQEDLPDVVSAPLSLRAWPPTPVALEGLVPVSSPTTSAFPPCGPGRRSTLSVQRLQHGALFEAAVLSSCSGPQGCSPPRSLLPRRHRPHGSRGFYVRASRGSFPPHAPDMLAVRIGQLTAEDFHLIRLAALSAAPGICTRWTTNKVSWRHRTSNPF